MAKVKSNAEYKRWTKREHPVFGDHGLEPAEKSEKVIGRTGMFPRYQWVKRGFSIIPPCEVTFGQWELFPVDGDVERFSTLKEAKAKADSLCSPITK